MEKDKGLFSFRKHPVGDFPDGKKERKRKGGRLRRSMGFLLAAALIFNTLPASGLAVSASEQEKGLCEHHRSHTPECGYAEAQPCTHEHGEECYTTVTECVHEHTDECYPETGETEESTGEGNATPSDAGNREPSLCTHVCSEESGCITKVLDCHHEHDESCGYKEAQDCGYVCKICNGTEPEDTGENTENTESAGIDTAECICEILCTEDSINGDCPVCGADDTSFLDCKGKVPEENTENQEDTGICKHHQEHDADCGYIPKSEDGEGSPCTYECRICPIEVLIAALPEQVTEDNADDVRAQLDHILDLYRELDEGEQEEIDLSRIYALQGALDAANAPVAAEEVTINNATVKTLIAEDGGCQGHTFTGTAQRAMIYVESGAHNVTFSGLTISESAKVGIAPGAAMNLTIEGTNTISATINCAGIYVPVDAALTIDGAGSLDVSGSGDGAGIGGAVYAPDESGSDGNPNCGTVEINGGTVTATGGSTAAGIGGGIDTEGNPGNGGNVTINSGTVTATGGRDQNGYFGGAGIGGGSGDTAGGSGGTLTINGGHVTLTAGNSTSYGFGQGTGSAPGGTCELTLTDASYLAEGTTLDPNGKYTINGDPTEDMIVVPELVYTGEVLDTSGIKIDDSKTGTGTYFGQTFTVNASADGWELQDLGEVVNAGEYTATFKKGDKEISKTFTVAQSGTQFVEDGVVKTFNGETQTDTFTAGDTITVKATPTATGTVPQKAAARLRSDYTAPTEGQMALFVGDVQVSEPVEAGADGTYIMTVSAADVLKLGGVEPNGNAITLTAKFVGNDNMADGAGTVTVNITAVAVAEKDGKVIGYYGESGLDAAFANSGNAGATFTLLANVERPSTLSISINCTLDLNGKTIRSTGEYAPALDISSGATVTIRGEGEIIPKQSHALVVLGSVTLEGGTFTSNGENFAGVYVNGGTLSITGEKVVIQNTSNGGYGLAVNSVQSVQLSAGTYKGEKAVSIVSGTTTLGDLLAHSGDIRYAYFDESGTNPIAGVLSNTSLTGTVTVQECQHTGVEATNNGDGTHSVNCPYCGFASANEPHSFNETGYCPACRLQAAAKVEKSGSDTVYVEASGLADAFAEDSGNDGATITLLDNITTSKQINVYTDNLTLDLNGKTYTCTQNDFYLSFVSLTIKGSGAITTSGYYCLAMNGGTLNIESGSFSAKDSAVYVESGGTLQLTGGSFTGNQNAIAFNSGEVTAALANYGGADAPHYAFYQGSSPYTPSGRSLPKGTFTVQECEHDGVTETSNNDGTHALKCPYCGYSEDAVDCAYVFSGTTGTCATCGDSVTVAVSGTENLVYDGTGKEPGVTVTRGETALTAGTDYMVKYENNINAGTATVTVTIGNGQGSYTGNFSITKATPTITWSGTSQEMTYTGSPAVITAPTVTLVNGENFSGAISYSYRKQGETAYTDGLPAVAGTYTVKAHVDAEGNYTAADSTDELTLTISYMAAPKLQYNGSDKKEYYNRDVAVTAVPADSHTYLVSDTLGGDYEASYTISAQEGTVTKTLYFKDEAGHMSDGVEVSVKFDLTPPTGKIFVGAKWWQNFLHVISFGNYKAKEYTVTIEAEDKNGSGISKKEYVIVTGADQYTDAGALEAANPDWKEYDNGSKPTVPVNNSQYVVYARLTDNAGNVTYISTDGILLDSTAPAVGGLTVPEKTKKDVTAGVTFTVSEAADYYYVVLPKGSAAPSAEDIIVTCGGTLQEGKGGTAIVGSVDFGKGAVSADTPGVSVEAENLQPYTAYTVYVTAVDRAVDITDSAEGTPAGNIGNVAQADFTTKKTLPVITKAPAVTGTYGQTVGEMTMTGGAAVDGKGTAVTGTWEVSSADRDKKPSAGTAEKVTVIFTPDSDSFDSVSVQITPAASPRNLNAEGVTVSEVAGNYTYTGSEIKPPVAAGTGTPTSGISISDSGAVLTANDFTVSYSNNKDAGTASVTITGKGNYTGSVTRTFTIGKAPGREVPDVSGSYTDNGQTYTYTITPTEGAVYRMGNDGKWQERNAFEGITPGTSVTFYAKMPGDKNHEDGMPKSITVKFQKLTPAAPALSYTRQTETGTGNITITITPVSGAEYNFDGGTTWKSGEGANVQDGFTTSDTVTLAIRLKETDTHNPSPAQTVTVNLAKEDREAPPAFSLKVEANGEADYTVTIPATEGCEYSFDGVTWSEANVKTGIGVGETVTGYKRYKETDDYNASSAVSAKETMPKFTVKTPVISPAGGSYSGSISVTITCGSTDAEIYYTTDGSTPGRSSTRYTGAFTVSAPATVKAVAIKDGLNDSAVATVSYTKKDGGGSGGGNSGGSSGGNENNGGSGGNDEGQGSGEGGSTNPGNGNTTPQPSVTQPTDTNTSPGNETAPGTGTTPVNPGSGNTVRPGTAPGSGTGTPAQGTKQPFIKGVDGKIGWDVIRAEEEQAQEGSTINVDMNGSVVVPGDIFDSIKGKDITITFDMGNGIIWSVDGKSITTDKAEDIDFSVKTGVNTVPVDIVNNVTGERYSIQISLAYEGAFGFTAVLSIGLGRENAGYTASLYYYNESTGELEFICSDEVAEDGTVSLAFTHASDYVIAIDGEQEEESSSVTEPAQPDTPDKDSTGQAWRPWWIIVVGALVVIMGIGVFFVVKKGKDGDSGQV